MNCLICEKPTEEGNRHVIRPTEEEREVLEAPLDSYVYCKPCWKILSDPVQGPVLMKGLAQQRLKAIGVSQPIAEAMADAYYKTLVEKILSTKSKS